MRIRRPLIAIVGAATAIVGGLAVDGSPSEAASSSGASWGRTSDHKVTYPTMAAAHSRKGAPKPEAGAAASGSGSLTYRGGNHGIGITTGPPKVYLVFWGSQWGTAATSGSNTVLSGDLKGVAPRLQDLFRGLGTNNELWSGVMTQFCEGVAAGASSCPAASAHVGYPKGGALAGVWVDNAAAVPATATDRQIAVEAVNAAAHFGNTAAASNRSAQYVIVSPSGTHPDGFNSTSANWCAWHDWNGDGFTGGPVPSNYGDIAFTNLPYIPDMGGSCGGGYVNPGNMLDGVTIVGGHEYAETITDQNPGGGWLDASGYENADKCSWIGVGGPGGAQNVTFATGTFPMQGTYSNDGATCLVSHPIVGTGAATNEFAVAASPGTVSVTRGGSVTIAVSTILVSGAAQAVALTATGLPGGVTATFNPASVTAGSASTLTLAASATATTGAASIVVNAKATSGSHTAAVAATVVAPPAGGVANGGFESGSFAGWSGSGVGAIMVGGAFEGTYSAILGSSSPTATTSISQTVVAPVATTKLKFAYRGVCNDKVANDWATVTLLDKTTGVTTTPLGRTCTINTGWKTVWVATTAGHSYVVTLTNKDNNARGSGSYTLFDGVIFGV